MNRRVLGIALATVGIGGILGASVPFFASLAPSEAATNRLLRIDIESLRPGQFATLDIEARPFGTRYIVLRRKDGTLGVFSVPLKEGRVGLPDLHWWRPAEWCPHFEPDFASGTITCREPASSEWGRKEWRWDLYGKSLGQNTENIPQPSYAIEFGAVVIGKRT